MASNVLEAFPLDRFLTPRERYFAEAARAVSRFAGYEITPDEVQAVPRGHQRAHLRFFAMAWLRWAYPELSSTRVGGLFRVHHSTVLYAETRAREIYPDAPFCGERPDNLDERLALLGLEVAHG